MSPTNGFQQIRILVSRNVCNHRKILVLRRAVVAHFLANNGIREEEIAHTRESGGNQNLTSPFTACFDLLSRFYSDSEYFDAWRWLPREYFPDSVI
jgi:hypothetical protein